jgi:hypothetical protein
VIFRAAFEMKAPEGAPASSETSDPLELDMVLAYSKGTLTLTVSAGEVSFKDTLDAKDCKDIGDCISVSINFSIEDSHFSASLGATSAPASDEEASMIKPLVLAASVSGKGTFQLGFPTKDKAGKNIKKPVAIFNELGVLFNHEAASSLPDETSRLENTHDAESST